MRDLLRQLMDRWSADGIKLPAGATDADIQRFEARCGVRLPADMAEYFRTVNGMGTRGPIDLMDSRQYCFWDLDSVVNIVDELGDTAIEEYLPNAREFFIFADECVCIKYVCINLASADNAVICITPELGITSDDITYVCDGFTAAIRLCLAGTYPLY